MKIIDRRADALQSILQMPEIPPPADYPEAVTLPELILTRTGEAIAQTSEDIRMRSINFRYRHDQWRGGVALRGTKFHRDKDGVTARANRLSILSAIYYRPHILMLTHPTADSENARAVLERLSVRDINAETNPLDQGSAYMLPTMTEMQSFLREGGGTTGNLVASTAGNFLLLRSSAQVGSVFSEGPRTFLRSVMGASILGHAAREADGLSAAAANQSWMEATAKAAAGMFVCYFADDPASPELQRVL